MARTLKELGLVENANYENKRVEVYHSPSETWFPLVETRKSILFYEDESGGARRSHLKSITESNFIDGEVDPVILKNESGNTPEQNELVEGLNSNTDYSESGLEVNHVDKGWFPLVRTSNKVIYFKEGKAERRMTPKKVGGVRKVGEVEPTPFDESVDTFFYDMVG